jgi:hypothetical protein
MPAIEDDVILARTALARAAGGGTATVGAEAGTVAGRKFLRWS